jgi:hypothetical protein
MTGSLIGFTDAFYKVVYIHLYTLKSLWSSTIRHCQNVILLKHPPKLARSGPCGSAILAVCTTWFDEF